MKIVSSTENLGMAYMKNSKIQTMKKITKITYIKQSLK